MIFMVTTALFALLLSAFLYAELSERKPASTESLEQRLRYAVIAMLEAGADEYDITNVCETAHQDYWLTRNC
jgi:hypothetical protein